ncbi:MAG: hypothetical protein EA384_00945 [Spirochaetaceae bacterium]|nr:MAG: hypothetical protein EA384_00945 [Spirochaetaceae bacterium]
MPRVGQAHYAVGGVRQLLIKSNPAAKRSQTVKATPRWERDYEEFKAGRGIGRAQIAMIRRL